MSEKNKYPKKRNFILFPIIISAVITAIYGSLLLFAMLFEDAVELTFKEIIWVFFFPVLAVCLASLLCTSILSSIVYLTISFLKRKREDRDS